MPFLYLSHLLNCRTLTACLCVPKFFLSGITEDGFFHILPVGLQCGCITQQNIIQNFCERLCVSRLLLWKKGTLKITGKVRERTLQWFGIPEQTIKSSKQSPDCWGEAVSGLWPYPFLIFSWLSKMFLRQVRYSF